MKLSIIIPCYNAEKHIERCVTSLVNQSLKNSDYEIIMIDDGSTDNSVNVIQILKKKFNNIVLLQQSNKGQGVARNNGISNAKGDYIYFLDADDYLAYNSLHVILDYLIKSDLDLIGFETIVTKELDLFDNKKKIKTNQITIMSGVDFMLQNKNHRLEAWWYIIKKNYLLDTKCKFEEGKFLEDVIFTKKVLLNAKNFAFLPIDIHRYVKNPLSTMNNDSQKHLALLINGYLSLINRLHDLKCNEQKTNNINQYWRINENIDYTSSLNTYFMFYKIIRSDISIKSINKILNNLQQIKAYPFKRYLIVEEYTHYKIKLSAIIFNNKWLFYLLIHPIRFLYKKQFIRLP